MSKLDNIFTFASGGIITGVAYLLGGVDNLAVTLALFVVLDYITGITAALYQKKLSSSKGYWGVGKKILLFVFVIVAHQLDHITGNNQGFLRDAVIMFLIGSEGISIIENMGKLGMPVPSFIRATLERLTEDKGDKQ